MTTTNTEAAPTTAKSKGKPNVPATQGTEATGKSITSLITDAPKLKSFINGAISDYVSAGERIHIAFVSALWHAAKHGNPALLNRVFLGLRPNDQAAVRQYVRRVSILTGMMNSEGMIPDDLTQEEAAIYVSNGKVVDFDRGEFVVVKGHNTPEAAFLVGLCEDKLIDPDGAHFKRVFDRDRLTEMRVLAESKTLASIEQTVKRAIEDKKSKLSPGNRSFLSKMLDQLSARRLQAQIGD